MRGPLTRRGRPRLSLRAYLVVLVVLCVVPMMVFSVWLTVTIAREQRAALRAGMQDTVRALAIAVDRDLRENVHTLQAVAVSRSLDGPDLTAVRAAMQDVAASQRQWLAITLYTPDGQRVLDTAHPLDEPAGDDPDAYAIRRVLETAQPVVSGATGFGPDSFAVRVPVVRAGEVHYVMSATVSGAAVGEIFRQQGLPDSWIGSLVDRRGIVLARHPTARTQGQEAGFPISTMVAREGWGGRVGLPEGAFYFAYARPELTAWHVVLAAPVAALDRPWLRSLGATLAGGAAFLLIGVGLATLACRPLTRSLSRLAEAAAELGRGHTPSPVDSAVADLRSVGHDLEAAGQAREAAEHAVRAREAQLSAIVNQATAGIAQIDLDGRFVLVNRRYCDLVGRTPIEMSARVFADVVHPDDRPRAVAALRELTMDGSEAALEVRCARPDASLRWMDASLTLVRDAREPRSVAIVALDATGRRVAEDAARAGDAERRALLEREHTARQQAETASQAKDEFLAVVSHELRTPLNALRLWAGLLRSGPADPATIARAADTIDRNIVLQARLIEDLLDVSRILSGRLRLAIVRVDLAAIIAAAIETVRVAADNKGIALATALDPDTGAVLGDPIRLQQVVWNLLSNAVRFTPAGGRVEVRLRRSGRDAELVVADTGRGITPELLPLVFDRFRQGESGTTRSHGGLGLGLSIARQMVELHGGTIAAASAGEGRGATFTVCLPLAAALVRTPPAIPAAAGPGGDGALARRLEDLEVLVVDDDAETTDAMKLALGLEGARVTTVSSVAGALTAIERRWPDVLVSDIGMPGRDGFDLIREVRRREALHGRHLPAIALTAYAAADDRRRAIEAGYEAHVPKPAEAPALASLITRLLSQERRA
ncbi:MAG TPA: ATP-binding protein [Methylomirabilota bacterium]|nr:ATP-binding protein [Methylomirabilota bacterium]